MAKKKHRGYDASQAAQAGGQITGSESDDEPEISISISSSGSVGAGELPEEYRLLLDRLRAGKVVLCTGAALGAASGRPTWRGIVGQLLDRLAESSDTDEARAMMGAHPLTTSGYVKRSLGDGFQQALSETLPKNGALPEHIEALGRLPFRAALTTAYDDLLERAFCVPGSVGVSATEGPKVYTAFDAEEIRKDGRGRYILHLLGAARHGQDIVFGAVDLQRILSEEPFRHVLHDLYQKRTFLFLGFDPEDPDFEILVDRLMAGAKSRVADGEPQHFAVLPGLPRLARQELLDAFGILVLPTQDPAEVVRFLRDAIGEAAGEILPDDDDMEGWLRVLIQEPSRADAIAKLDALEGRLRTAGDAERLIDLYVSRVEVETEPARRAGCLRRAADLLEHEKGQMAEAFATMLEAYREDPQPFLLDELERLAGTTGQWVELLTALREIIANLPAGSRADVWVRIARLYGDKLNHLEYALASLAEAQKLDIADPSTRRQLRELRVELSRRAERWKDLAEALGQLGAQVTERERKIDLYMEQGDLYESRLSDGVSAAAAYKKALEADSQSRDAMTALEHLLRRHRNWTELLPLLDQKAVLLKRTGEGENFEKARKEAASIATEHLSEGRDAARDAIDRWEAIREGTPRDLDALRALEKLYAKEGSYSEHYLAVLNALADCVPSDKERLNLYRRLAAEYEELPGHGPQAAACLERILDLDPTAEDAYRGLQRLYRQDRRWVLLVDTYRRHARNVQTGRAEHYAAIGRIYEIDIPAGDTQQSLLAAPQSIEAWTQVLELEPEHKVAMESLSRLHERTENWDEAVRLYDKRANLSDDKAEIVSLRHHAARLTADHLLDYKRAEERFVRALEVDPQHLPTMTALVELYRQQGEYLRAARLLIEAVAQTHNRLDKTRYLVEAAELYATIDDQVRAAELYLQALAVDPEHVEAGVRAADLLWHQERWAELVPILEMLTRKEGERGDQGRRLVRLGDSALKSGDEGKALKAYTRAAEIVADNIQAQRGRAKLLVQLGRWQEALDAYVAVLTYHRDELGADERVELFYWLGECERRLSRTQQAKIYFAQAVEIDSAHRLTLQAQLLLGGASGAEQIQVKRALLLTASAEEKVQLLTEIGDLLAEVGKDPDGALQAFREGLALRPGAHVLLHKCLDLLIEKKDWAGAMATLDELIAEEKNVRRRARYRQTAALIARDELKDYPLAVIHFDGALDDDPTLERAAADLERLVEEQQDHRELARIYRRKIKQLGPDSEGASKESRAERLRLWSALGQLCLLHLNDPETAMAALEVAVALDRGGSVSVMDREDREAHSGTVIDREAHSAAVINRRRQLASLYVQAGPDRADKAILEHQTLLRLNKGELSSYRALKKLYLLVKQREKAAHVAYALHILKKGEPEDEKLVAELAARPLTPAKRSLKLELARTLAHPEEDLQLGALFQAVLQSVQLGYARPFKDSGLSRKDRVDPGSQHLYARALRYGVEVLDAAVPEVYLQPDQKDRPYTVVHCSEKGQPPVICVQIGAQLLNPKRPEREVMYEMGRLAAMLRPKRTLRTLLPTAAQLGMIIDAAMVMGGETGLPAKVMETAQGLKRSLAPTVAEQVAAYGKGLREAGTRGEQAATAWLGWSDMTAVRAGLVLAGDLETVALLLATDPPGASPLSPKQRLLELIHFSVSEEYFTIRQYLGLM